MSHERIDRPGGHPGDATRADERSRAALPPSHLWPRTSTGRLATVAWVALFLVAMPPVTHTLLDRPDVWIAGVPFLFAALMAVYFGLIAILLWALRRGV